ncbi:hypothetical protein D3C84_1193760 [compost metagenome]
MTCNFSARLWRLRARVTWRATRVRRMISPLPFIACTAFLAMLSTTWISCSLSAASIGRLTS